MTTFLTSQINAKENSEGVTLEVYQEIPHDFIKQCQQERFQNSQRSSAKDEMHRVMSIPVVVWDKWIRDYQKGLPGSFDPNTASVATLLAKLKQDGLDCFITSDKGTT